MESDLVTMKGTGRDHFHCDGSGIDPLNNFIVNSLMQKLFCKYYTIYKYYIIEIKYAFYMIHLELKLLT